VSGDCDKRTRHGRTGGRTPHRGSVQNAPMHPIAQVVAATAALIHVWFFLMESVWFMQPRVFSRFGLASEEQARVVRSFAYNQGFYNLFLSVGVGLGLGLVATGNVEAGRAIALFACGSMVAAGVVLVLHNPKFLRAAAIQVLPALVAVLGGLFLGGATGG
jgi:putative membrane protein